MLQQQITVFEGARRESKSWKPKTYSWDAFVERLKSPIRTRETVAEYKKMTKDDRDNAKDIGGFVGGVLQGHARKRASVQWRTMLTLDADDASMELINNFEILGYTGVIYSTHSHTKEKPRLRLVVPLAESIEPNAYPALINYLAVSLGVDQFDPTTDEVHRLMYWPSCSTDGDYVFKEYDGELFDGKAFLGDHPEWNNAAMWQLSERKRSDKKRADKTQDPREKKGLIGAFCRVYDIHSAIEAFLDGVYEPTNDGRYTYTQGSTVNGVVTYDDLWSYSHHSTDPAGGILCNAWDLVRIHLFGSQDLEAADGTPTVKLPSYISMMDYVKDLDEVTHEAAMNQLAEAQEVFSDDDREWMRQLTVNGRGKLAETIKNCRIIMMNDPRLKGMVKYNELSDRIVASPDLPWRGGRSMSWSDDDTSRLYLFMEEKYGLVNRANINAAWSGLTFDYRYHPVRDYLNGLVWDGVPRLETMLVDYLGADNSAYVREVTRKWAVAAVARVMDPGVQFDYMILLVGSQGIGKTTFLKRLAGREWFTESLDKLGGGKDSAEQLKGYWVVCVDELSALKKIGEAQEQAKNFITRTSDSFRPAYGHHVIDIPRQCVFAGTTNEDVFLRDPTGARRFWPVMVRSKNPMIWSPDFPRDQLWAEAVIYYRLGEDLYLTQEIEAEAKEIQKSYTDTDSQVGYIMRFIQTPVPENFESWDLGRRCNWYRDDDPTKEMGTVMRKTICSYEIYCEMMGGPASDFPRKKQYEINNCLRSISWLKSENRFVNMPLYGKQRVYEIVEQASEEHKNRPKK